MTETLKWIMTKDHIPFFEECEGKIIECHFADHLGLRNVVMHITRRTELHLCFGTTPMPDRYILFDVPVYDPEPVPCKVCGELPHTLESCRGDGNNHFTSCESRSHTVYFNAPTRAEAIQLWNKWNGG